MEDENYVEKLKESVSKLVIPPMSRVTKQQHNVHHRYFNALIKNLEEENIPVVKSTLHLIADMNMQKYSARYIGCAVSAMRMHKNLAMDPDDITMHIDIKSALENVRKNRPIQEDTRIPLTAAAIWEMCEIADKDFAPHTAILFKALLWTALTCMLRQGELSNNTREDSNMKHSNFALTNTSITATFHGWKLKSHRRTLMFPFIPGTEKEVYTAVRNYLKVRAKFDTGDEALFVDENGIALMRFTFQPFFHHLVDYCSYSGLNVTCHSLRNKYYENQHHKIRKLIIKCVTDV